MYTTYNIFDDLLDMRNWIDRYFTETPSFTREIEYPYVNIYEEFGKFNKTVKLP